MLILCIEFLVHYVCFLHIVFLKVLKRSDLGLCSLFTFKQAFGQLQEITKRNELKNTFYLHNRIKFLWLIQSSAYL